MSSVVAGPSLAVTATYRKPSGSRPADGSNADSNHVLSRRRRSRSAESRRSRKENNTDIAVTGKKRKTTPLEERPKSPSVEVIPSQSHLTRKRKGLSKQAIQRASLDAKKAVAVNRRPRRNSHDISSQDESEPNRITHSNNTSSTHRSRSLSRPTIHCPNGVSEVEYLTKQVMDLRMEVEDAKKSAVNLNQVIETLRKDLAATKKMNRKQCSQIEKLKVSGKKSDELLSSIQGNLQCQICLELLEKPYALSPCGHVLCQKCLQEWFRSAPGHSDDDGSVGPVPLYRKKTCPCCRTRIYTRPIQLFLLKSMVASLCKDNDVPSTSAEDGSSSADPWAGIFPQEVDLSDSDYHDDNDDDDDDDDLDPDAWSVDMGFSGSDSEYGYGYGSDSDAEPYDGEYVRPRWVRAQLNIEREEFPGISRDELRMMRRGATLGMIHRFDMQYDSDNGLVAVTDDDHEVFLGWNIDLSDEDENGEFFMLWIQDDIFDRPERWEIHEDDRGFWTAWRLVREDTNEQNNNH